MPYIPFPITTNPDELVEDAFAYLEFNVPGWVPAEGNLDVWVLEACARMASTTRDIAADVPDSIFQRFGTDLMGLPYNQAAPARAAATFTVVNPSGFTLPAGLAVAATDSAGIERVFRVETTVVAAALETSITAQLVANEVGAAYNGLTAASPVRQIDAYVGITAIEFDETTSGGADAESDVAYMVRLSRRQVTISPSFNVAADAALLSMDHESVGRALGIDLYNPTGPDPAAGGHISVAVTDIAGSALSGPVKAEVEAMLEAYRQTNIAIHVIDPTYSDIDVTTTVKALPGYDTATVDTAVTDAIISYLDPGLWGSPGRAGEDPSNPYPWRNIDKVRFLEVAQVINAVDGVDYIVSLTVNAGSADVTLTGPAPLPNADAIAVTVT
jgi:hypothetical protein